jgi:hypothetical protein
MLPQVRVFDADTRVELCAFLAYDPAFRGGVRVAVVDVTGDGVPDVITGAGDGGARRPAVRPSSAVAAPHGGPQRETRRAGEVLIGDEGLGDGGHGGLRRHGILRVIEVARAVQRGQYARTAARRQKPDERSTRRPGAPRRRALALSVRSIGR